MTIFGTFRLITPDGLTLAGDIGGPPNAPAVVLMHGGGQTRHSWHGAMVGLIERGYHVVNYDSRGHGESDWSPTGDYGVEALAADLRAVLETLGRPVALVGASMGGMSSFYAVGSAGRPIADALVMVDITLRPEPGGAQKIVDFMLGHQDGFASLDEAADAVSAYNPSRPRPSDNSGLMKNLRLRDDGRYYWHWDPRLMQVSPRSEPPSPFALLEQVSPNVTLPTLLVRGGKSDIVSDQGVREFQELVPQIEVFDVPGAGHMVAGDRNDAFNAGVIGFLERHLPIG